MWCTPSSLRTFVTCECFMMIHTYVHTVVVVVKSFQSLGAMFCMTVCVICKLFMQRLGVHTYIRTYVHTYMCVCIQCRFVPCSLAVFLCMCYLIVCLFWHCLCICCLVLGIALQCDHLAGSVSYIRSLHSSTLVCMFVIQSVCVCNNLEMKLQ